MSNSSVSDIAAVLDAAGSQWAALQAWKVVPLEVCPNGPFVLDGPAFIYRWESGKGSVGVSFWPGDSCRVANGKGQMLAIQQQACGFTVMIPGSPPLVIGDLAAARRQPLGDLIGEARSAHAGGGNERWVRDLVLMAAGMRLVALVRDAALAWDRQAGAHRPPEKDHLANRLHEWLRPNLERSLKLSDAARHFKKSPRQLIRILKETTGTGFADHLTIHRLTLARTLLMRNGHSVMEVARLSGFNSREQFIRAFNKAFGWTPLQFRKAWDEAARGNLDLSPLCRVCGREAVEWLATDRFPIGPMTEEEGPVQTLVVANALHEIVELFRIDSSGRRTRVEVLDRGAMAFVSRDHGGSCWLIRVPASGEERLFRTPVGHALAAVAASSMAA
ncbi:MAG: AraC family transcriptional regulator [Verrucomicrobia bacterium]|nr:MAG: AraC family transcriptional regulator [Verrucomicrobiota bacterium]TAE85878.1 MAG: AraC family transcriptional regulator [Verrucomicrobiota bacterium]TAF27371.1 MAG: AraC family transcriptional regulator [Verrucomicrobiota bacterium]TAF42338.1 MAG: AraC family transcriptional regulator [Verrucomicrobiota bacterium]